MVAKPSEMILPNAALVMRSGKKPTPEVGFFACIGVGRYVGFMRAAALLLLIQGALSAQEACPPTPAYAICEIAVPGRPAPEVRAEFRSPSHKTFLIQAFSKGGNAVLRVSPTEPGAWDFRIAGSENEGHFTATASPSPGLVETANVHHFRYSASRLAHLWMGDIAPQLDRSTFEAYAANRAKQGFNHVRVTLLPARDSMPAPDQPNAAWFDDLDQRILALNRNGITADLVIAPGNNQFAEWFGDPAGRESVMRYLVARYGAMNITWQIFENFESYDHGRELSGEIAGYLKNLDQYRHLISTGTTASSGPLFGDGWMKYVTYRSPDGQIAAVEHQIFPAPSVNDFRGPAASANEFRRNLWRSTMAGQYPETAIPDDASAQQMKVWHDFFASTRYWELEPYYDVEGATAVALPDVEYVIYVERPGPIVVNVEKHSYDVEWIDPSNGERVAMKNLKNETFSGEPPGGDHDWVLHISREGHKAGMLKSYKFESREILMQEVESDPAKVPFDILEPAADSISMKSPVKFAVKLRKETRGTRHMLYEWTAEVSADNQSYRVVGSGAQGTFEVPPHIAYRFPASLHLRVTGMNALGKVYIADKNIQLTQ